MNKVVINAQSPDFTLLDTQGIPVSLGSFKNTASVYLVLNRGLL